MGIIQKYSRIKSQDFDELLIKPSLENVQYTIRKSVEEFDIDKAWEVIHFLLTGEKHTLETTKSLNFYLLKINYLKLLNKKVISIGMKPAIKILILLKNGILLMRKWNLK